MWTNEQTAMLLAHLKVERDMNKFMKGFGFDDAITISDLTRAVPQEMKDICYKYLDDMERKTDDPAKTTGGSAPQRI